MIAAVDRPAIAVLVALAVFFVVFKATTPRSAARRHLFRRDPKPIDQDTDHASDTR